MLRNVVISTSIDNILDSQDLLPTGVGTTGWLLHEENSETLSPVSGVDEDIAEPGEGRCVGDPTAYPYLLPPLRGVAPEGDGARYRTSPRARGTGPRPSNSLRSTTCGPDPGQDGPGRRSPSSRRAASSPSRRAYGRRYKAAVARAAKPAGRGRRALQDGERRKEPGDCNPDAHECVS